MGLGAHPPNVGDGRFWGVATSVGTVVKETTTGVGGADIRAASKKKKSFFLFSNHLSSLSKPRTIPTKHQTMLLLTNQGFGAHARHCVKLLLMRLFRYVFLANSVRIRGLMYGCMAMVLFWVSESVFLSFLVLVWTWMLCDLLQVDPPVWIPKASWQHTYRYDFDTHQTDPGAQPNESVLALLQTCLSKHSHRNYHNESLCVHATVSHDHVQFDIYGGLDSYDILMLLEGTVLTPAPDMRRSAKPKHVVVVHHVNDSPSVHSPNRPRESWSSISVLDGNWMFRPIALSPKPTRKGRQSVMDVFALQNDSH